MKKYRTHTCVELTEKNIGEKVKLSGWIEHIRDHGGVIFIDLRDHYGITQIVVHDDSLLSGITKETVITVEGEVSLRDADTVNEKLVTGKIEVVVNGLEVISSVAEYLPFEIEARQESKEELRLKYRYLDLRNKEQHDKIVLRSKVVKFLRDKMDDLGFLEINTPILTCSSPEGARDYLVPSRKHSGKFYALPQAPQQFKQLLMTSGFDKYFQIAPCFRDEDARADRSPGEFYQLDLEMAFATQEDVFEVSEAVLKETFRKFSDKKVTEEFPKFTYKEVMDKYGTDKPDLRNPLVIEDLTEYFMGVEFPLFQGKPVKGIVAPDCRSQARSFFDGMLNYAMSIGMKGLGYLEVLEDGTYKGPIAKFLADEKKEELRDMLSLKTNDVLFFVCDSEKVVSKYAGLIRSELGRKLDLIDKNTFEFCFIKDYPMYEINEESGKLDFTHNPFSMPQGGMEALRAKDPLEILAYQYDIVCNGIELSSGAVRNHLPEVMLKAFSIAGYKEGTIIEKFGALYKAFKFGAPPHAGIAPGVDRILMLLTDAENIREVIAFPMNGEAMDLMMNAPGEVSEKQLREVHIKLR